MRRLTILLLFLLSGAAGLIYQIVWMRKLTLIMGVTHEAVSTVLGVFMGGLALGSWLLGRAGDETRSPLRFYGWLELGIALFGVQSVFLLDGLLDVYVQLRKWGGLSPELFPLVRFLLAGLVLLGPTTLMGATLPVLIKGVCRTKERIARVSGLLYAINTLGAVAGTFFAAFYLIQSVGIRNATFFAAGINLFVGFAALWLARREPVPAPEPLPEETAPPIEEKPGESRTARAVVVAFGISGFLALAYEVLWTRYLIYVVGENSVYAFATMLAAFLVGIVLGSLIASWLGDRIRDLVALFGGVQVLIGAGAFATVAIMGYFVQHRYWGGEDFWMNSLTRFGKCMAILIIPTTLSGSTFALVAKIYARRLQSLGQYAGRAYAMNTLGAIFGAAAGGFLILPYLKLRYGLIALGTVNVLVGLWILLRRRPEGRAIKTAVVTTFIAAGSVVLVFRAGDPAESALIYSEEELVFYADGPESSVAVTRSKKSGDLSILVDGDGQAGTDINSQIHLRLLGHLPALFHPDPKEVLCIAFGAGISLGSLAQHPVERVDIVELSRPVIQGAKFFEEHNHDPLNDSKVNLIYDDGRNFLLSTENTYDVITTDPVDPDDAGITSLYSKEFYELVRSRLNDGGVACQWITTHYGPEEYRMLIRTFMSVFPNTSIWYADYTTVVVGLKDEPRVTLEDMRARFEHLPVRESLEVIGISDPETLLPLCLTVPAQTREFAGEGSLNTDDRPLIEYLGPRADNYELMEKEVWEPLFALHGPGLDGWIKDWTDEDRAASAGQFDVMAKILKLHQIRSADWDLDKKEDLSPEERDRRFIEKAPEREAQEREYLDLTWDILGSPVPRLFLIMAGVGNILKKEEVPSQERLDAYERSMENGFAAWRSKDYSAAYDLFMEAGQLITSKDNRTWIMAAACLDRQGELIAALKRILDIDMSEEEPWSEVRWMAFGLMKQIFRDMDQEGADRAGLAETLLELTPSDEERPEQEGDFLFGKGDDAPPAPRPAAADAEDADAWRLWLRDAQWDLDMEAGRFVWRKKE